MRIPATLWFAWLILVAQFGYLHAQDTPYKGKTVRVLVGFPSAGGSDAEGRVLARHLGKYIPGNPNFDRAEYAGRRRPDLLMAKDAEPVLRQVLTVSPRVQEFVKAMIKKHLQR
jgi:hypothetical protein